MEQQFTIIVFTENKIGLLNRITIIFTRRHINIEALTTSESEVPGIHRFTIVVKSTRERIEKVVKQIEKLVEVLKASLHEEHEVVQQELALYKVDAEKIAEANAFADFVTTVKEHKAEILTAEKEYIVIQKMGSTEEVFALFQALGDYHVLEFAKSGRVALTKSVDDLDRFLKEKEAEDSVVEYQ